MSLRINVFHHDSDKPHSLLAILLHKLTQKVDSIMTTQAELTLQVQAATTELQKIGGETSALIAKVAELQAALAAAQTAGSVTQELVDAVSALSAQAKVVDDLVPNAPPPATPA